MGIMRLTTRAPMPPPDVLRIYWCSNVRRLTISTRFPATSISMSFSMMCRFERFWVS